MSPWISITVKLEPLFEMTALPPGTVRSVKPELEIVSPLVNEPERQPVSPGRSPLTKV